MIKIVAHIIMIFTNHSINSFIIKQIILFNNNTNKLNFKLVRALIYLSQFNLNVKYSLK